MTAASFDIIFPEEVADKNEFAMVLQEEIGLSYFELMSCLPPMGKTFYTLRLSHVAMRWAAPIVR